jgi:hypothetical protein
MSRGKEDEFWRDNEMQVTRQVIFATSSEKRVGARSAYAFILFGICFALAKEYGIG